MIISAWPGCASHGNQIAVAGMAALCLVLVVSQAVAAQPVASATHRTHLYSARGTAQATVAEVCLAPCSFWVVEPGHLLGMCAEPHNVAATQTLPFGICDFSDLSMTYHYYETSQLLTMPSSHSRTAHDDPVVQSASQLQKSARDMVDEVRTSCLHQEETSIHLELEA